MKVLSKIRQFLAGDDSDYVADIVSYAVALHDFEKECQLKNTDYIDADVKYDEAWTKKLYLSLGQVLPIYTKPAVLVIWLGALLNKGGVKLLSLLDDLVHAMDYEQFFLEQAQWADKSLQEGERVLSKVTAILNDAEKLQRIDKEDYAELLQMKQVCDAQLAKTKHAYETAQLAYDDVRDAKNATLKKLYGYKYEESLSQKFSLQYCDDDSSVAKIVKRRVEACWALGGQETGDPSSVNQIILNHKKCFLMAMCNNDMNEFVQAIGGLLRESCDTEKASV